MLFVAIVANAQFFVSSTATVDVIDGERLYTAIPFENEGGGTVSISNGSIFEFDSDFTNDGVMNYEVNPANPGILKIGSGTSRSGLDQDLLFNGTASLPVDENIPLIQLEKDGGTATITRGHVRVTNNLLPISGTLDANSSITGTSTLSEMPNTDAARVIASGLTFNSNATSSSYVAPKTSPNPAAVNNVIVERYIPGGKRAFRAISSSVTTNGGTVFENLMEGGRITLADYDDGNVSNTNIVNPRPGYGTHITGGGSASAPNQAVADASGFDVTQTTNPSMFIYDNPDAGIYSPIPNTAIEMDAGESFFMMIRGDRNWNLADNINIGIDPFRLRMRGDLRLGDVTFPSDAQAFMPTTSGAFASIGNPYHAQVSIADVLSSTLTTNVDRTQVYVRNPTAGVGTGIWVTLNFNVVGSIATFDSSVPNTPGAEFLQPNQAMYIVSSGSNPQVRFEESFKRSTTANVDVFSDGFVNTDFSIRLNLIEVSQNDLRDGILLRLNDSYSDAFIQAEDAESFVEYLETLSTVAETGELLTFDKRSINDEGEIIQIQLDNFIETDYFFTIEIENNNNQDEVYLIDNYLGTSTLIDADNYTHNFSVNQNVPASIDSHRFQIGVNMTTFSTDNSELTATGLNIYPNPADTTVNLSLKGSVDSIQDVKIISMDGKLVKNISLDNLTSYDMDISDLASGVYIINATSQENTYSNKLIIQ